MSMDIVELNNTINQLDIMDTYWLAYTTITAEYRFLSNLYETFTKTGHIMDHKTPLSKFKSVEIMQCLLSDHNDIKLDIINRKINGKSQNRDIKEHTSLRSVKEKTLKKNLKLFWTKWQWNPWDAVKAVLRGEFIALNAYVRKVRKSFHLRKLEKEQIKFKASRRKEIIMGTSKWSGRTVFWDSPFSAWWPHFPTCVPNVAPLAYWSCPCCLDEFSYWGREELKLSLYSMWHDTIYRKP